MAREKSKKAVSLGLLRQHGGAFVTKFLKARPGAIGLQSKEPAVCWGASGVANFAVVSEFSGPNTMDDDPPLLFRIRVNMYPPPALYHHLKSKAVRRKLRVATPLDIASGPELELHSLPEEVEEFGGWIPAWCDKHSRRAARAPKPPTPLLLWSVNEDLTERFDDFVSLGSEWHKALYLWTPRALELFSDWWKRDSRWPRVGVPHMRMAASILPVWRWPIPSGGCPATFVLVSPMPEYSCGGTPRSGRRRHTRSWAR
jgi:hypothetical protein